MQLKYQHDCRDHFVFAPSQWETTLHCNVVSHWLGANTKWSPFRLSDRWPGWWISVNYPSATFLKVGMLQSAFLKHRSVKKRGNYETKCSDCFKSGWHCRHLGRFTIVFCERLNVCSVWATEQGHDVIQKTAQVHDIALSHLMNEVISNMQICKRSSSEVWGGKVRSRLMRCGADNLNMPSCDGKISSSNDDVVSVRYILTVRTQWANS